MDLFNSNAYKLHSPTLAPTSKTVSTGRMSFCIRSSSPSVFITHSPYPRFFVFSFSVITLYANELTVVQVKQAMNHPRKYFIRHTIFFEKRFYLLEEKNTRSFDVH